MDFRVKELRDFYYRHTDATVDPDPHPQYSAGAGLTDSGWLTNLTASNAAQWTISAQRYRAYGDVVFLYLRMVRAAGAGALATGNVSNVALVNMPLGFRPLGDYAMWTGHVLDGSAEVLGRVDPVGDVSIIANYGASTIPEGSSFDMSVTYLKGP